MTTGEQDKKFLATYIRTLVELDEPIAKEVANELFKILNDEESFHDDYWFVLAMLNCVHIILRLRNS